METEYNRVSTGVSPGLPTRNSYSCCRCFVRPRVWSQNSKLCGFVSDGSVNT